MTMHPFKHSSRRRGRGSAFTLVEIMVTTVVAGIVVAGTLSFFIQALNVYHYDAGKVLVNRDIRAFTSEITDSATYANYFLIYPSFTERTTTTTITDPDTSQSQTVTTDLAVNDGQSGDMLVLVYRDPDDDTKNQRIVGYFRAPDSSDGGRGPVRKFEVVLSPTVAATTPVTNHLPAVNTMNTWPEVIELSRGLANGKLFYNFYDRSVMVKGQIFHRGSQNRRATNTYNFTVSPRG